VRPCVEHILALVGRLQVHMLATGPAVRTSSILAAATSSTILQHVSQWLGLQAIADVLEVASGVLDADR
jgi:hypothetical protein